MATEESGGLKNHFRREVVESDGALQKEVEKWKLNIPRRKKKNNRTKINPCFSEQVEPFI